MSTIQLVYNRRKVFHICRNTFSENVKNYHNHRNRYVKAAGTKTFENLIKCICKNFLLLHRD